MPKPTILIVGEPDGKSRERLLAELGSEAEPIIAAEASVLLPAARRAEIVFLWDNMRRVLIEIWPELKQVRWIHTRAAGLDRLWFTELLESPALLTNAKGIYSLALAEFVIGAMLFFVKDFRRMLANQAERRWEWMELGTLRGQTVGILGYGDIGQAVARKAKAFDMRVIAVKQRARLEDQDLEPDLLLPAERFEEMMAGSDYVVLTTPLTPQTRGLIGERALRAMRPTAYLINVGRGAVVQEAALVRALEEQWIAGAALDVFEREPLLAESPFYRLPNVLLSPHSADHTPGWVEAGLELFLENFRRYRQGQPLKNVVDKRAGY
jgi:phosphoglycerate dehydrogenase-like enzyme